MWKQPTTLIESDAEAPGWHAGVDNYHVIVTPFSYIQISEKFQTTYLPTVYLPTNVCLPTDC